MELREGDSRLIRYLKIDGVGEGVHQCSADFARHGGELEWLLASARTRAVNIAEEAFGELDPVAPRRLGSSFGLLISQITRSEEHTSELQSPC